MLKLISFPVLFSQNNEPKLICDGNKGCRVEALVSYSINGKTEWFDLRVDLWSGFARFSPVFEGIYWLDSGNIKYSVSEGHYEVCDYKECNFRFVNQTDVSVDFNLSHFGCLAEIENSQLSEVCMKGFGEEFAAENTLRHFVIFGKHYCVEFLSLEQDQITFELLKHNSNSNSK